MTSIPRLKPFRFDPQRQQPLDVSDLIRRPHRNEQPPSFRIRSGPGDRALHVFAELHPLRLLNGCRAEIYLDRESLVGRMDRWSGAFF
jgi:hypothetical protein